MQINAVGSSGRDARVGHWRCLVLLALERNDREAGCVPAGSDKVKSIYPAQNRRCGTVVVCFGLRPACSHVRCLAGMAGKAGFPGAARHCKNNQSGVHKPELCIPNMPRTVVVVFMTYGRIKIKGVGAPKAARTWRPN